MDVVRSVGWVAWIAVAAALASCGRAGAARWLPSVSLVALARREGGDRSTLTTSTTRSWSFGAELRATLPTGGNRLQHEDARPARHARSAPPRAPDRRELPCASRALCLWERTSRLAAEERLGGLR